MEGTAERERRGEQPGQRPSLSLSVLLSPPPLFLPPPPFFFSSFLLFFFSSSSSSFLLSLRLIADAACEAGLQGRVRGLG